MNILERQPQHDHVAALLTSMELYGEEKLYLLNRWNYVYYAFVMSYT
jgi:hypothetical protein